MPVSESSVKLVTGLDTAAFLQHLESLDVRLSIDGDRLHCDAPKGQLTPNLVQAIAARKSDILAYLTAQQRLAVIQPQPDLEAAPLSIGQQAVWSSAQLAPGSSLYNMYLVFRLAGTLDCDALNLALHTLLNRHTILRCQVQNLHGEPHLVPCPAEAWNLQQVNISDEAERLDEQIEQEIRRPFDLGQDFLLRASLYRRSDQEHTLCLVMHHLAADGWSWAIFLQELSQLYEAFQRGQTASLPTLPVQYADYALWQRAWVESPAGQQQLADWRAALADAQPLNLNTQQAAVPARYHGRRKIWALPGALAGEARRVIREQGTTLFNVLLTAAALALQARTGQDEVLIVAPAAGREHPETHGLVGYFNNLLPLRLMLGQVQTGLDALKHTTQVTQQAFERQGMPFSLIAGLPEFRRIPLAQAAFAVDDGSSRKLVLPGLEVIPVNVYNETANFPFFLSVEDRGTELLCTAEWQVNALDDSAVEEILENFELALRSVLAKPDVPIALLGKSLKRAQPAHHTPVSSASRPAAYVAPVMPWEHALVALWEQALGVSPVGMQDNFFELGGNSLMALRLFRSIEQELAVNLPLSALLQEPTPAYLAQLIEGRNEAAVWDCLVPIQPNGWRRPFFGVHGKLGNVLFWRLLAQKLGSDQPFYGLQAPGLDGLSDTPGSIPELAQRYLAEIRRVQPHGPYALGGYSLGGEIAFEIAQQLTANGEDVALLVLFDTSNPQRPANPPRYSNTVSAVTSPPRPQYSRIGVWQRKINRHLRRMRAKNLSDNLEYLRNEAQRRWAWFSIRLSALPYRLLKRRIPNRILIDYLSQRLIMALDRYHPQVYPGKITLFRARQSLEKNPLDDPQGWAPLAAEGLDVHIFESRHDLLSKEFVDVVGSELWMCLWPEMPVRVE